jgi:hypothetical protein
VSVPPQAGAGLMAFLWEFSQALHPAPLAAVDAAGGHGMRGITLGPVTGRLLAEQIASGDRHAALPPSTRCAEAGTLSVDAGGLAGADAVSLRPGRGQPAGKLLAPAD